VTDLPVQAVWVWRFTKAPYKATYGRLPGTTYSKDFLQVVGECAETLSEVLNRGEGEVANVRLEWPGGSRDGTLFEAADYDENGRLDLRWETNNAPEPWKLFPDGDPNPLKTFPGDPTLSTAADADGEFDVFQGRNLDPWLVAAKLFGQADILHVRAYLGNPPPRLEHAHARQLPERVKSALERVPRRGGCAALVEPFPPPGGATETRLMFDPAKLHDAWSLVDLEADSFRQLVVEEQIPASPTAEARRRAYGGTYRAPDTDVSAAVVEVFTRDPVQVERGLRGHNVTQERLAELVRENALIPRSSTDLRCDYDLAWDQAGMVYVAEVKSLTRQNERLQLRLGLGQVLEYAHRLRSEGWMVQPVLAVEREPSDPTWVQICEGQGVRLVWPAIMGTLFD
jgi:hypothetical protein